MLPVVKSLILTLALGTSLAAPVVPDAAPTPAPVHPAAPWASLVVPGAGQMLAGDTTTGLLWLGAGVGAGAGTYAMLRGQMPADALVTPATPQFYFLALLAYAAWLGVGAAATVAGLAEAAARAPRPVPLPLPATEAPPDPTAPRPAGTAPPRKPRRTRPGGDD
jgi:hypothetical protein